MRSQSLGRRISALEKAIPPTVEDVFDFYLNLNPERPDGLERLERRFGITAAEADRFNHEFIRVLEDELRRRGVDFE